MGGRRARRGLRLLAPDHGALARLRRADAHRRLAAHPVLGSGWRRASRGRRSGPRRSGPVAQHRPRGQIAPALGAPQYRRGARRRGCHRRQAQAPQRWVYNY